MNDKQHPVETVIVGEDEHEIEVAPLTLVCKAPDLLENISYPKRFELTPEQSLFHAERTKTFDDLTPLWIGFIIAGQHAKIDEVEYEHITPDWCRSKSQEVLRVAGLVDLTIKLTRMGIPLAIQQPETGLHPAMQCQLASFFVYLINNPPERTLASLPTEEMAKVIAAEMTKDLDHEADEAKDNLNQ